MAVGEAMKQARSGNRISQVSWTDWVTQDVYYWLEHSFQYSSNINTDDELHWIKLSTCAIFTSNFAKCQLTSVWDNWVAALDTSGSWTPITWFDETTYLSWGSPSTWWPVPRAENGVCPWVVFQDYFWFAISWWSDNVAKMAAINVAAHSNWYISKPYDHVEATDESISDPSTVLLPMKWPVTAMLNYNNTRLVVATGWDEAAIWVYYPELDQNSPVTNPWHSDLQHNWETGWKKVWTYEAWVTIVWLTCSFEYLKVWAVDEWWNTQVYYYQGNNNLRNTYVYNLVDLKWVRVIRVYSINGIDYYVSSIDWTDWFINLYKLVWTTPVQLFKQRAWLSPLDVNYKAPYFVWPTSLGCGYWNGRFYIADAYGLFQFTYEPNGYDKGYMKRGLYNNKQVYGVCLNKQFLYVSTQDWCYMMRVIDTWLPAITAQGTSYAGYQPKWVLISREYEGKEWGTVTKVLDEIRMNFELNPLTDGNGNIDVYVSPNNLWKSTSVFTKENNWYHVMHITQDSAWTRTEKSNILNNLWEDEDSSFKFDWQTITYAIVITRWSEDRATPIVRQLDIKYHCKDKVNNVYDIN